MALLYILIYEFAYQGESMLVRRYGRKYGDGGFLFNGVVCLFAMLFFVITDEDGLYFAPGLWKYGIVNGLLYAAGFYFAYLAYRIGPYLLSHTITGLNFVLPISYGLFFLHESANYMTYLALACTLISFFLMVCNKSGAKEDKGFSLLWLLSALTTLFSTGFIAILSKKQQAAFDNQYTNEYMIITLACSTCFLLLLGLLAERKKLKQTFLKGGLYGMGAGLLNGAANFASLLAMMLVPLSFLTPMKMALAKPLEFCVSFFIYKERYTLMQYLSIGFGILSVVFIQAAKYI